MSASREKQNRRNPANTNWTDLKSTRETEQERKERHSSLLYRVIAVVFLIALIASIVWRSNIIPKTATAATVDGEKYTAAEVSFYYQNSYVGFMNQWSYMASYLGLDPNSSLSSQQLNDTAAAILDTEAGQSWHDYFMDQTLTQIATVQKGLEAAEAEGFEYPAGMQAQYDAAMDDLAKSAASSGVSLDQLLKHNFGSTMTEKVYGEQLLRMMQYRAYAKAHEDSLTYSDEEIAAAYKAAPESYDKASYEYVLFSASTEPKQDEEGNPIEPTEEETAAAKAEAKAKADKLLASYRAGGNLEKLAEEAGASYTKEDAAADNGGDLSTWVFDKARTAGQSAVVEGASSCYVVVFHDRFREEYNTIDVRHILIQPEAGKLTKDDEGYEEEQAKLKADAHARAEELLAQWKSGEATEASFGELAMQESADGSKFEGGLYTQVVKGKMVPSFNDWCFAENRKPGDTDVVDSDYGSHVMYFVGENLPCWKTQVVADLKAEDFTEWEASLTKDVPAEVGGFGSRFVG